MSLALVEEREIPSGISPDICHPVWCDKECGLRNQMVQRLLGLCLGLLGKLCDL